MTYWHMQLYPGKRRIEFPPALVKRILNEKNCIGLGDWEGKKDQIGPFINEMKKDDIVLIRDGESPIALVKITGDHEYTHSIQLNFDWFENRRNVEVLDFYEGKIVFPQARGTLQALRNEKTPSWRFIDKWYNGIKGKVKMKEIMELLKANKNLILTGAPGTGKTYLAYQLVTEVILNNYESFLNSYKLETKGIVGPLTEDTKNQYLLSIKQVINDLNITLTELFTKSSNELQITKERYLINGDLKGADKNGNKSASIGKLIEFNSIQFFSFVQFHPSYDYTDFVEGLRPKKEKESKDIGFELKNGIFKQFCLTAKANPCSDFVFIIDEINRGEISKIFGELFFSMDPGYRGEKGKVKTQYANMQTNDTCFSDEDNDYFYIPKNVYIIGTMNDIDRSVESFDFAIRRRFVWKEITAKDSQKMLSSEDNQKNDIIKKHQKEIEDRMDSINKLIGEMDGLGSHYQIGAAYFLKLLNHKGDFNKLWQLHLEPLLREYLRGMQGAGTMLGDLRKAYDSYKG